MRRKPQKALALSEEDEGPDIWQRLSRLLLAVLLLLVMGAILSLFWPEIEKQKMDDGELHTLRALRDETLARRQKLAMRLEWMKTDPEYLEAIARDRLDLHKEGELIIRIDRGEVRKAVVIEE